MSLESPIETPVIVSFSGGPDSIYLVLKLLETLDRNAIVCVYFEHGLREKSKQSDRKLVKAFCEQKKVKLIIKKIPVMAFAKQTKQSVETSGRQLRKDILWHLANRLQCKSIVTGHHLNDNAETFLFQLIRGTKYGLHTIRKPYKINGITWAKPLHNIRKETLLNTLKESQIDYIKDETNHDISISRNRIRHRVINELNIINSRAVEHINRAIDYFDQCHQPLKDKLQSFKIETMQGAGFRKIQVKRRDIDHISLTEKAALLHYMYKRLVDDIRSDFRTYSPKVLYRERIPQFTHHQIDLILENDKNITLHIGKFFIFKQTKMNWTLHYVKSLNKIEHAKSISLDHNKGNIRINQMKIEWDMMPNIKVPNIIAPNTYYVGIKDSKQPLVIRSLLENDQFVPFGKSREQSVHNYLKKHQIPKKCRQDYPVLTHQNHIVLLPGIGVTEFAKVEKTTWRIVKIMVNYY